MIGLRTVIVGAGGHATVVADALISAGQTVDCFVEADTAKVGKTLLDRPVVAQDRIGDVVDRATHVLANGIGGVRGTELRRRVQETLEAAGWTFVTVRHPAATISGYAQIADGAQLLAGSIVQPGARIGRGVVVNTGAIVEHDCAVDAWTHIAPGATLCGNVMVGEGCIIGAGSVVIQGVRIGAATLIAAGAAVIRDFEGNGMLRGVPARAVGMSK